MFRTYIECNNYKNNQKYSYKKSFSTFREELSFTVDGNKINNEVIYKTKKNQL